jgi:hypothetical protein
VNARSGPTGQPQSPDAGGALPGVASVDRVDTSWPALVQRRLSGGFAVDPWGLDTDLLAMLGRLDPRLGLIRTEGAELVPDGPALLLWRGGPLGWIQLAVALGRATGRPVRCTGVPDLGPVVGVARRLGGVGGDPADLRGLLRAGGLVAVRVGNGRRSPDWLRSPEVAAAVDVGAPLVPVTVHAPRPWAPVGRVVIASPVPTRSRMAPRPLSEVAARTAAGFDAGR